MGGGTLCISPRLLRLTPIISEVAKFILYRVGDAGMKRADFFKNPAFKGLIEKQISLALAAEAAPIFEASGRVYWLDPSGSESSN